MPPTDPILALPSLAAWKKWLAREHARSTGVLLRIPKGDKGMTYAQALDVALCWGWIDSQKQSLDESAWLQRFTPRRSTSPWSKINRAKAEALIAANEMQAPGLAEVTRAKKDGRWDRAYDGAKTSEVPADLAAAFAKNRAARRFFDELDRTNRYAILYRVQTAKKPETRADRIGKLVAMCSRGEKIHASRVRR